MKLKKMLSAGLLTLVMCTGMTATAFADDAQTTFNLYVPNDPTYTITVPTTIDVSATEITKVPVTASDVSNLPEGKKISVTYKYGSSAFGRFGLDGGSNPEAGGKPYGMTMMLKGTGIMGATGDPVKYPNEKGFESGANDHLIIGMELAAFTTDGEAYWETYPCAFDNTGYTDANLNIQKGVQYSGWMTYGIEIVDIPAAE